MCYLIKGGKLERNRKAPKMNLAVGNVGKIRNFCHTFAEKIMNLIPIGCSGFPKRKISQMNSISNENFV